ncbi:hypothetical protein RHGRI_033561 [Rhododendron griersonianum]|uniref:Prolamin-like domain-containing protein n=1 Tax=Rhododendron griersonianum TaxID=479676 RepID=A0AAV6HXS8_9ERIC|nr:hypothetical protein RHGRI_033561 [Rhododendron griersonianum]
MAETTNQFSSRAIAAAFCFAVMGIILTEGQQDFLTECRKKLAPGQCGWQIGNELYTGNATVDQQCCSRLLDMGEKCHKELLKNYLSSPDHANINATEVWQRSDILWSRCSKISAHP